PGWNADHRYRQGDRNVGRMGHARNAGWLGLDSRSTHIPVSRMVNAVAPTGPIATLARQVGQVAGVLLLALVMLGMGGWGALALHYWDHANPTLRKVLVVAWILACIALIALFLLTRWRWRSLAIFIAL